jgi:hypothetical protein
VECGIRGSCGDLGLNFVQYVHCELKDLCLECLILSFGA